MDYEQPKPRAPMVPGPSAKQVGIHAPAAVVEHAMKQMESTDGPQANMVPRSGPVGNIAKAIAAVMKNVGTIQKRGWNDYYKYHYATMEDILQAVTPLIGENGLAVIQNEVKISIEGTRIAVLYEFSIFHESGEVWPEKPRFTGMAIARTRKGEFDDKAINKCHTAARKYFLLSMFQVPAGDFDDADSTATAEKADANQPAEQRPVPGPKAQEQQQAAAAPPAEGTPHKITLGQGAGADQWGNAFIRNIGKAKTEADIMQFERLNDAALDRLNAEYPSLYEMLCAAVNRRIQDLSGSPTGMPNPKEDTQEAMNWIASQLQMMRTYEGGAAFWNTVVAPREKDFDTTDWNMLIGEFDRMQARLGPKDDEGTVQ